MKGKNYLLAIGINDYSEASQSNLKNAVSDTKKFIKILEERYSFERQDYLFDNSASLECITNALVELKHFSENDNLIIFFAGHGIEEPDSGRGYIIPYDGKKRHQYLSFTSIKSEYLADIKAKHVVLVLDCCYASSFLEARRSAALGQNSYDKISSGSSRYFLGSGTKEPVRDGKKGESSPFMDHFLKILQENTQKNISITEIGSALKKIVGDKERQQPVCEAIHELKLHQAGKEFVFELSEEYQQKDLIVSEEVHEIELDPTFVAYLNDTGVAYLHQRVDELQLPQIFIEPYLSYRRKSTNIGKAKKLIPLWGALDTRDESGRIRQIVFGEESSGKTSIAKMAFMRFFKEGFVPILLNGGSDIREIRKDKLLKKIKKIFSKQYQNGNYNDVSNQDLILIIDDFHKFELTENKNFKDVLVKNLNSLFANIILLGDTLLEISPLTKDKEVNNVFYDYEVYEVQEFGPKLRHELVVKWFSLGQDLSLIDLNELHRILDEREMQLETIIGKNYMPAYPFYLLSIIQVVEGNVDNLKHSLHGFYYEHLINQQLNESVNDKQRITLLNNYMTEFAFHIFEVKEYTISISDFSNFHQLYDKKYEVQFTYTEILEELRRAKLLTVVGQVEIRYKYIYYFFVARYLTNNLSSENVRQIISKMVERVYREEYANIIMFITHLSKDSFILEEILRSANAMFEDVAFVRLDEDVEFFNALEEEIPKQVIENVDTEKVRANELEERERIEVLERDYEKETRENIVYDLDENIDEINLVSKVILAFKTIEILGQLTKKYWGSMTSEQKTTIIESTYLLGLRTTGMFLSYMQTHEEDIVAIVTEFIEKKSVRDKYKLKELAEKYTREFVFKMAFLSVYGMVKKVASSTGNPNVFNIMEKVLEENQYHSVKLIDLAAHLEVDSKMPINKIEDFNKDFFGNKLCSIVLRSMVLDRLQYFDENLKMKRKLSEILDIPLQQQRIISASSKLKKAGR